MSVAKVVSRAVGKVRKRLLTRSQNRAAAGSMINLGTVDGKYDQAATLHNAAILGTKAKLNRVLIEGSSVSIDYPNSFGQTPLFCACAVSNEITANLLLQRGADPNVKDHRGVTPVHVVCYTGNVALLRHMMEEGGNVCLTDNQDHGILEWAAKNKNIESRNAMMAFLQQTPLKNVLRRNLTNRGKGSEISLISRKSAGFGQAYPCTTEMDAIVSVIPVISETKLKSVGKEIYRCSLDFNMKEMLWHTTEVSIKTLESECETSKRLSLILSEASFLSKLRHSCVITLMALCQPPALNDMMLVLERVHKNLFHFLHADNNDLSPDACVTLAIQICSGMGYIHDQGFVHCALSSHAVYLTHSATVKLGNLEFMMERSQAEKGVVSNVASHQNIDQLYNWMAPEMICGNPSTSSSDFFSFCCLFWEMFTSSIPWYDVSSQSLHEAAVNGAGRPRLSMEQIPQHIETITDSGIYVRKDCGLDFDKVYTFLKTIKCGLTLNKSHNSLSKSAPLTTSGQSLSKSKSVPQDKLVFTTSLRSNQSTPTIAANTDTNTSDKEGNGFNKNCSDGDIQQSSYLDHYHHSHQQVPGTNSPLIKPASHSSQSPPAFASRHSINRPRLELAGETKNCGSSVGCVYTHSRELASLQQTPYTVRQLADDYHQIIMQHKLRQEILKGSMAPHGGWETVDSPLNSTRWHSLPSTIKELSKMWSPNDDTAKTGLSDLGNLSCATPCGAKQTSTPLRRITTLQGNGAACNLGLVDFFQRQRNSRDTKMSCQMVEDGHPVEVDPSTKLKAASLMEEMKTAQSMWRRRVLVDEEDEHSIAGVSYNSPVIEVQKRRTCSVTDNMNHTILQTSDELERSISPMRSLNDSNESEKRSGGEVDEEQLKIIDDSFENFRRNLRERRLSLSPTRSPHQMESNVILRVGEGEVNSVQKELRPTVVESKDVEHANKDVPNDLNMGIVVDCTENPAPTTDSFWDLTTHWPKTEKGRDFVDACPGGITTQEYYEEGTLQRRSACPTTITNGDQNDPEHQLEQADGDKGHGDGSRSEGSGGHGKGLIEVDGSNRDKTFSIAVGSRSSKDRGDLNTTFTLDPDFSETDSWFPDTVPSDGSISRGVCQNVNDPKTKETDPDEIKCGSDLRHEDNISVEEEVKVLEGFEFQEFYIDDDLDTSENIQPVSCNGSPQSKDCDISKSKEGTNPNPMPSPPSSTHNHNNVSLVTADKFVHSTKLTTQSLFKDESELSIVQQVDCQIEDVKCDVRDKIALFDGKVEGNSLTTMYTEHLYSWMEKKDVQLCMMDSQTIPKSANDTTVANNTLNEVNNSKHMGEKIMERHRSVAEGKIRLIPKIKKEDIKLVKSRLSSKRTNDDLTAKGGGGVRDGCHSKKYGNHVENEETIPKSFCVNSNRMQHRKESLGMNSDKDFDHQDDNGSKKEDEKFVRCSDNSLSKESSMYLMSRSMCPEFGGTNKGYYDECDSDDWLSQKLHSIQEKIRRRSERSVYTISSEDEEEEEEGSARMFGVSQIDVPWPYDGDEEWDVERGDDAHTWGEGHARDIGHFKWNTYLDEDNGIPEDNDYSDCKLVSVSSSERLSLPQSVSQFSFSRLSNANRKYQSNALLSELEPYKSFEDENSIDEFEQRRKNDERLRRYKMRRMLSSAHYVDKGSKSSYSQRSNSQSSRSKSMDKVQVYECSDASDVMKHSTSCNMVDDGIGVCPTPRPRPIRGVQKNDSRSSVRTVMFEDETDGLKQFSSGTNSRDLGMRDDRDASETQYDSMWVGDGGGGQFDSNCDDDDIGRSYHYDMPKRSKSKKFDKMQGFGPGMNKTFVLEAQQMEGDAREEEDVDGRRDGERLWSRALCEGTSQHCLTLGLGHDQADAGCKHRDQLCKIGDNVYTEVHRFYIPKSKWPDGCKTQFHLDVCPTNPRRHRISTTAIDPVTGRQEVLMEKTVDTDRLKSHLAID